MNAMILSLPALVKTLCVFGLILVLNRFRISLSYALLIGSLAIGLWMGLGPGPIIKSAWLSILSGQTVSLGLIVGAILVMSRLMKESGHLERIVKSFSSLCRDDRTTGAVMPALIGLLPMPGGALFSAPMVDTALCRRPMSGEEKAIVNYWFRHIWEIWCPIYPGVVLAVTLLEVDTWRFMVVMLPVSVLVFFAGVVFILRPLGSSPADNTQQPFSWKGAGAFLWEIMPILVIVMVILVLAGIESLLKPTSLRFSLPVTAPVLTGLVGAFIWVCAVNRLSIARVGNALLDRQILPMLLLVFAIMIFKGILSDSKAAFQIQDELLAYHIPVMLVILLMPFISGFITGVALGYVGISFPLILPLFQAADPHQMLITAAVAYTFGFIGMMLSPVHLCFLVTKDYFKASLFGSYRGIFLPILTVLAVVSAGFWMYRVFQ